MEIRRALRVASWAAFAAVLSWSWQASADDKPTRATELSDQAVAAAAHAPEGERVARAVHFLATHAEKENIKLAITVTPLDSGRVISSHRADDLTNPASNTKIATAAYALTTLGPEHRFETHFATDRQGSLYVRGGFDPTLNDASLLAAARQLKASGVTAVRGDVVLDAGRLKGDRTPAGFDKYGGQRWEYLTPPSALAVDKDRYRITVSPSGEPGATASARSDVGAFKIKNDATVGKPGERTHLAVGVTEAHAGGLPEVHVWGTIAPGDRARELVMRSPDPLVTFGDRMTNALSQAGIAVEGRVRTGETPSSATTAYVARSAPLREILQSSLAGSNEFDHEMFAVAAASKERGGAPVTVAEGAAAVRTFVNHEVRLEHAVIHNASGLGNVNRFTTRDIATLLRYCASHERTSPLLDALARPGVPHTTLSARMVGTEAETRLAAKTGTEGRNIALSGVVNTPSQKVAFSSIVSSDPSQRREARALVDAAGITLSRLGSPAPVSHLAPPPAPASHPAAPPPSPRAHR